MKKRTSIITHSSGLAIGAALALSVAGCHAREPVSPEVGLTNAASPPRTPDLGRGEPRREVSTLYNIYLGEPLRDLCKGPAPFFEFNSTMADAEKQPTMQVLAECMSNGPLRGENIKLIGHTDPRGSAAYNQKLGLDRAQRVKRYLVAQGIAEGRVSVESVGESQASGFPADYPSDRRVEIQLVK